MKNLIKLFILFFILGSCTIKENIKMETGELIIKNEVILNNLEEYYNKHLLDAQFEYVLTIDVSQVKDTSTFIISYEMNLFALTSRPPLMYTNVNNMKVAIRSSLEQFFGQSEVFKQLQLKEVLPTQFKMYEIHEETPPPTTFRNEVWVLKFKGGKFISKEIRNDYIE